VESVVEVATGRGSARESSRSGDSGGAVGRWFAVCGACIQCVEKMDQAIVCPRESNVRRNHILIAMSNADLAPAASASLEGAAQVPEACDRIKNWDRHCCGGRRR